MLLSAPQSKQGFTVTTVLGAARRIGPLRSVGHYDSVVHMMNTETAEDAINLWTASGKGLNRIHRNPTGWTVSKVRNGTAWAITRPDGTPADGNVWPSALAAELQAYHYETAR